MHYGAGSKNSVAAGALCDTSARRTTSRKAKKASTSCRNPVPVKVEAEEQEVRVVAELSKDPDMEKETIENVVIDLPMLERLMLIKSLTVCATDCGETFEDARAQAKEEIDRIVKKGDIVSLSRIKVQERHAFR